MREDHWTCLRLYLEGHKQFERGPLISRATWLNLKGWCDIWACPKFIWRATGFIWRADVICWKRLKFIWRATGFIWTAGVIVGRVQSSIEWPPVSCWRLVCYIWLNWVHLKGVRCYLMGGILHLEGMRRYVAELRSNWKELSFHSKRHRLCVRG